jgi:glycosyltransferase involved in cell wall biosynthesis
LPLRLLVFNLATDADDPMLGHTTVWLNALAARCAAVDVITMRAGRLALAPNVRVISVGKERGYSEARRAAQFYAALVGLLREQRYTACFAHMNHLFAILGAPLLKAAGVPITLWYAHKSTGRMLGLAERLVDHVVTASAESFRLPSRKVLLLGHGIDTTLFCPPPVPVENRTILSVSRIAPVKRLETLIAALHQPGLGEARLRIVGEAAEADAAYAERLRRQAAEWGVSERVTFTGGIPYRDTAREYQSAAAAVNLSATGSIDKAVLEAMACGVPVVTCNEAFQTMLAPWRETLWVPPESPEVLPLRLERVLALSAAERAAMGQALRQIVAEGHSLDRLMDRLVALWLEGRG